MTSVLLTWDDTYEQHESVSPTWPEIERRVRQLDGVARTLVTILVGEGHAAVGGGWDSGLVVYVTFDGATFQQLIGGSEGDPVIVVAGGQSAPFPRPQVVDGALALVALRTYVESGALNEELTWERS